MWLSSKTKHRNCNVAKRRKEYYVHLSRKINDLQTGFKKYYSILKTLCNGNKVTLTSHLPIKNKLLSNFKEKEYHFNSFLAFQCTSISDKGVLSATAAHWSESEIAKSCFKDQNILKIIRSLDNY